MGKKSSEFQEVLGYYCAHEVAHRSDIVLVSVQEECLSFQVNPSSIYERYQSDPKMVESSEGEAESTHGELEPTIFSPIPIPIEGEMHV